MKLSRRPDDITPELIYSKIDMYDIYRYYMKEFKIGAPICNHHRGDKNPSFVIYVGQSGHLFHKDYADERFRGGPFDLVKQLYPGMNYDGALQKVAADFGIADSSSMEYKTITSQYVKPVIDMKKHALIHVSARKWTDKDLEYWAAYGISQEQLRREDVYCIKEWSLNRRKQFIAPEELCFAYRFSSGFKIYYPTHEKGSKWYGNICISTVENLSSLENIKKVLIVKSKKDRMCLENIFPELRILSVQNESRTAFSEAFVNQLTDKDVWISYDSDEPGKKASLKITKEFGYRHINVPDKYVVEDGIKDWADVYKRYGPDPIVKHFKDKKFYEKE